jgi:hypothetical protein
MTDSTDNPSSKPISVAELLAKNGTIGAPPVGGRRRRRRGDTDSISVAELTGEIPIYSDEPVVTGEIPFVDDVPVVNDVEHEFDDDPHPGIDDDIDHDDDVHHDSVREPTTTNGEPELLPVRRRTTEERTRATKSPPPMTQAEADYAEHVERRRAERELLDFAGPPVRRKMTTTGRIPTVGGGAEQMSPDPAVEAEPSYVRSSGRLFGGQTDDGIQQDRPSLDEIELGDDADQPARAVSASASHQSPLVAGALIVGQCILAVALGAGLFIAFDQLWQWNNVVALVLSVLVILGLVVGVRVVRKTEDIGSTLIAVAVGAMVTLGPLVLLRSH